MSENVTDDRVDPAPGVEVLDTGEDRGFDGLFDRYCARAVRLACLAGAGDQARAQSTLWINDYNKSTILVVQP